MKTERNKIVQGIGWIGLGVGVAVAVKAAFRLAAQTQRKQAGGKAALLSDISVVRTIIIDREPDEIYRFCSDVQKLPLFIQYVDSADPIGENRAHWKMTLPADKKLEWDSEIHHDPSNRRIAWRVLPGAPIDSAGSIQFEPAIGDRGTFVRLEICYVPPGGVVGSLLAKLFGQAPGIVMQNNLRHLKQLLETGEIAKSDASIHTGMHPAQPAQQAVIL